MGIQKSVSIQMQVETNGYWELEINWEDGEQIPVVGRFGSADDAVRVLNKYLDYSEVILRFCKFDDPSRF